MHEKRIEMNRIKAFVKKETVFTIAILLAAVSAVFVPPSAKYLENIDFRVLALLFCLMFIVAGIREQWIFRRLAEKLVRHVSSSRPLELILVMLPFFLAMLITNDVALITFVPFALALLNGAGLKNRIIRTIVLQTIAANLGSMLTPVGNPQNLYLYSVSGMGMGEFVLLCAPYALVAAILLFIIVMVSKKEPINISFEEPSAPINKRKLLGLILLFAVCLLTVVKIVPWQCSFLIVFLVGFICYRNLFKDVDYYLLGTFIGFFIFIGNMQEVPVVTRVIDNLLTGREMLVSVLISQVISNVPAAMLLSGFSDKYAELIIGVNIGGLGTLIASLASLISYKFYAVTPNSQKGKYVLQFTLWNLLFIAAMLGTAFVSRGMSF